MSFDLWVLCIFVDYWECSKSQSVCCGISGSFLDCCAPANEAHDDCCPIHIPRGDFFYGRHRPTFRPSCLPFIRSKMTNRFSSRFVDLISWDNFIISWQVQNVWIAKTNFYISNCNGRKLNKRWINVHLNWIVVFWYLCAKGDDRSKCFSLKSGLIGNQLL